MNLVANSWREIQLICRLYPNHFEKSKASCPNLNRHMLKWLIKCRGQGRRPLRSSRVVQMKKLAIVSIVLLLAGIGLAIGQPGSCSCPGSTSCSQSGCAATCAGPCSLSPAESANAPSSCGSNCSLGGCTATGGCQACCGSNCVGCCGAN
jgi:hypothetical protein